MANLGVSNASYYADNSISRVNRQVDVSVEKISSNKANVTNGDKTSLVSMDNVLKLDIAATNAAVKNMSVAQAYLSTAISTLDNASAIMRKIHQLAVMGAKLRRCPTQLAHPRKNFQERGKVLHSLCAHEGLRISRSCVPNS